MKTFNLILSIFLLGFISLTSANAQEIEINSDYWSLNTGYNTSDSYDIQQYKCENSINFRVNFQIDITDPLIQDAVINGSYELYVDISFDGYVVPTKIIFNPDGIVKVIGHLEINSD